MQQIKNIIFDLGGVLLNVDYNKTAAAFKRLGFANFDELYSQSTANDLFENLETGKISEKEFYDALQAYNNTPVTQKEMELAWNEILLDFRKESLAFLTTVKNKYNLFLLSNTNSIHQKGFNQIYTNELERGSLDDYFIKSYYSHLIHMRKPYRETYEFVLKDSNLNPEETLFIDDSIGNMEGAVLAGIQVHLLLPGQKIEMLGL
ncbi:MAG: HAD family phosphatase [Sphingobacteriales bacterium]|nr:HAD family phosphatase [Sphingobacteriales bacterium]